MKTSDIQQKLMEAYYVEQLHKLGFYQTDNLSYDELKYKLAALRAITDIVESDWF